MTIKPTEADIAFEILKERGGTIHYKELVDEIIKRRGLSNEPSVVAAILTQINLDTRFSYYGQGEWGLRSKSNARATRRIPTITLMHKSYDTEDETSSFETNDDLDALDFDAHDDLDVLDDDRRVSELDQREDLELDEIELDDVDLDQEDIEMDDFLEDVPDPEDNDWDE